MKRFAMTTLALFVMALVSLAHASTITHVNEFDTFNFYSTTHGTKTIVENFEDTNLIPGLSITEVNGPGTIELGIYENWVDDDPGDVPPSRRYQVFNYSPGMYGFGGWFDLAGPSGPGSEIDVYIHDTDEFVTTLPNTAAGQFYGFFSDESFTGVRLEESSGVEIERYAIVDLAISPIPIPASALLLATGLLGLVGLRLRRK